MDNYVSLIVDIEKSRRYEIGVRNEIQSFMDYCVNRLNKMFSDKIKYEVTFSAGDELQGMFMDVTSAVMYFRLLEMLIKPVNLRAGIGVGEWNVKIENGTSTQQDGPVYHNAREAIYEVHKSQLQNIKICSSFDDEIANHLINASLTLKRQQLYMQNLVMVIVELLYPFIDEDMVVNNFEVISELIQIKFEYRLGARNKTERRAEYDSHDLRECSFVEPIIINGKIGDIEKNIIKRNTSSIIAEILKCTRQNVETIMRRGNVNKIRELDFMSLQYLKRQYKE